MMSGENQRNEALGITGLTFSQEQLLGVSNPPSGFKGQALAARTMQNYLRLANEVLPSPITAEWAEFSSKLVTKILSSDSNALLLTATDELRERTTYSHFISKPRIGVSVEVEARIKAAAGISIVAAACQGRIIPDWYLENIKTLLNSSGTRGGRNTDWTTVAQNFPLTVDEIKQLIPKLTYQPVFKFLTEWKILLQTTLKSPADIEQPKARAYKTIVDGKPNKVQPLDSNNRVATGGNNESKAAKHESLLGWVLQRGNNAGFRGRFGIPETWDRYSELELIPMCEEINKAYEATNPHRNFAFLATICISTSLSADVAIKISTTPNGEIWLDAEATHLNWYLGKFISRKELPTENDKKDLDPRLIIPIFLPEGAAVIGLELISKYPDAKNIGEMLVPSGDIAEIKALVQDYRSWLIRISLGPRPGYDARYARSLGQIYRETGSDIAAGFGSLDIDESPMGVYYYIRTTEGALRERTNRVLIRTGLGEATKATKPEKSIGSAVALDINDFTAGWKSLILDTQKTTERMMEASTVDKFNEEFKRTIHLRLIAILESSGHRGNHLDRILWDSLIGSPLYMLCEDKDVDEYTAIRGVAKHKLLSYSIESYITSLDQGVKKARSLGIKVSNECGIEFNARKIGRIAFSSTAIDSSSSTPKLLRKKIDRKQLDAICRLHFKQPLNCGRHTLMSLLNEHDVEPGIFRAFGGHHHRQAEPLADGSWISANTALRQMKNAIDWILRDLIDELGIVDAEHTTLELIKTKIKIPNRNEYKPKRVTGTSRARILDKPWERDTWSSIKIIKHLQILLAKGKGPSDHSSAFLLSLILFNHVTTFDLKSRWNDKEHLAKVSKTCLAINNQRTGNRAELIYSINGLAALIALSKSKKRIEWSPFNDACMAAGQWLAVALPNVNWGSGMKPIYALDHFLKQYLRFHFQPATLAAASAKITAATPNRTSILRLSGNVPNISKFKTLLMPTPGPGRRPKLELGGAFKEVMKTINRHGQRGRDGESLENMKSLRTALEKIDTSLEFNALAVQEWGIQEANILIEEISDPIANSSMSSYLSRFYQEIQKLDSGEDLREWFTEWLDWYKKLIANVSSKSNETLPQAIANTKTAARRFLKTLYGIGYSIPLELLRSEKGVSDGMRKSASASLIFKRDLADRSNLLKTHFINLPLVSALADLAETLCEEVPLRAAELSVLGLESMTASGSLVITTDGFSHLKSLWARRHVLLSRDAQKKMIAVSRMVKEAYPDSRWYFLLDDPTSWATSDQIDRARTAALKQTTGDGDARKHSTRPAAAFRVIFPEWEVIGKKLFTNCLTVDECSKCINELESSGFNTLLNVLAITGHGHPFVFLKYYFSIWTIIYSLYSRASLASIEMDANELMRQWLPQGGVTLRKARERQNEIDQKFDAWTWMSKYASKNIKVDLLQIEAPRINPPLPIAKSKDQRKNSIIHDAIYLSCRITGMMPESAADATSIGGSRLTYLETLVPTIKTCADLRERHQALDSTGGRASERRILTGDIGSLLTTFLNRAKPKTINKLENMLIPQKNFRGEAPQMTVLLSRLLECIEILPETIGIKFVLGKKVYAAEELENIESLHKRVIFGGYDQNLGPTPRITIFPLDSTNTVWEGRYTAIIKCLIFSIKTIREDFFNSESNCE